MINAICFKFIYTYTREYSIELSSYSWSKNLKPALTTNLVYYKKHTSAIMLTFTQHYHMVSLIDAYYTPERLYSDFLNTFLRKVHIMA